MLRIPGLFFSIKNIIAGIFLIIVASGCQDEKAAPQLVKKPARYARLLSHFPDLSFDTLMIYSPEDATVSPMLGKALDSLDALLFPKEIAEAHFQEPPGIFAIGKFAIDNRFTALIARVPSTYVPSSITLFFYDNQADSLKGFTELAESFGDAGDVSIKYSWLFRNQAKMLQAFMYIDERSYHSAYDERDTAVDYWGSYFLLDLSKAKADTISKDSASLVRKFGHLIPARQEEGVIDPVETKTDSTERVKGN